MEVQKVVLNVYNVNQDMYLMILIYVKKIVQKIK